MVVKLPPPSAPRHVLSSPIPKSPHQSNKNPLRFPPLFPTPSPFAMSAEHHPNATTAVYSLWFGRLLEILWDERATESCLTTRNHTEWLAWAHGARWLVVH